jgi:hypothetical protein
MITKRKIPTLITAVLIAITAFAIGSGANTAFAQTTEELSQRITAQGGGILDIIEREKERQMKAFIGSWEGVLTPEEGGPPPFRILFTFGTDGTVVASDAGPPNPQNNTAEHGAWELTNDHEFTVIYKQLLFNSNGELDSTFKGRVRFKLDESRGEINGLVKVDIYDLQGTAIISGAGTIKCTKIRIESLD